MWNKYGYRFVWREIRKILCMTQIIKLNNYLVSFRIIVIAAKQFSLINDANRRLPSRANYPITTPYCRLSMKTKGELVNDLFLLNRRYGRKAHFSLYPCLVRLQTPFSIVGGEAIRRLLFCPTLALAKISMTSFLFSRVPGRWSHHALLNT